MAAFESSLTLPTTTNAWYESTSSSTGPRGEEAFRRESTSASVFHLRYKHASSSRGMGPHIGHSTVVKLKPWVRCGNARTTSTLFTRTAHKSKGGGKGSIGATSSYARRSRLVRALPQHPRTHLMLHHPYWIVDRIVSEPSCAFSLREAPDKGIKSEVAASPLPSRGSTSGRKCYVTPPFSRVPKQGNKCKSGCLPCLLGGPQEGGSATYLLHSRVSKYGDRMRSGCLNPAFSGAHKRAEVLCTPCILGGSQTSDKHRSGCPNLAFLRAHNWAEVLCNLSFSGVPRQGDKIRSGYLTPTFFGDKIRRGTSEKA